MNGLIGRIKDNACEIFLSKFGKNEPSEGQLRFSDVLDKMGGQIFPVEKQLNGMVRLEYPERLFGEDMTGIDLDTDMVELGLVKEL